MNVEFDDQNNQFQSPGQFQEEKKGGLISRIFVSLGLGGDAQSAQMFILIVAIVIFIVAGLIYFL